MRLARMGGSFQTRISFSRRLIRRMHQEKWRVERRLFDLDCDGFGKAIYVVKTTSCCYSLVCFSHHLDPKQRTDRVIANAWDATFSLFQGIPRDIDINRLEAQTPRQEAGRFKSSELVLSRANKSLRIFDSVVNSLAEGRQPDPDSINKVGYLMRTTAVYANGKFGMADRTTYADQLTLTDPFQAEMLTVYLIRGFTHDLVDHMASFRAPGRAVTLDRAIKRHLGVGNATGLGMAPFLISHPQLIHNWFFARETGLSRIRSIGVVSPDHQNRFRELLVRAKQHIAEWVASDSEQNLRIASLLEDMNLLAKLTAEGAEIFNEPAPWDALVRQAEGVISIEGQELLLSLLFEPYPELIDELAEGLQVDRELAFDPTVRVREMQHLIEECYSWALALDFSNPLESHYFWYYSEEKEEPRRGVRRKEAGADKEIKIAVAQEIQLLYAALQKADGENVMATFLASNTDLRHVARRVQIGAKYLYAEIQDNLIAHSCKPIDILRGKLAFFGASKFDPKSDLWTRITMYQGAPLNDELDAPNADDWSFPIKPVVDNCTSP